MKRISSEAVATIVIALLSLAVSTYVAYAHNDKQIEHRLSVVETQQDNDKENLSHVRLQVDRLVDWAMGGKK